MLNTAGHQWLFGRGPAAGKGGDARGIALRNMRRCEKDLPEDFFWGFQMPRRAICLSGDIFGDLPSVAKTQRDRMNTRSSCASIG